MRKVELRNVRNFACQGANLRVEPGELLVLLGPNGAGKTTLLNVVAGLIPYEGTVLFDDVAVDAVPARERQVGYVFQDLVLFPHLSVAANVAFGLEATSLSKQQREARVGELLEFLEIDNLAQRYPAKLSGGEKQRVALARALAPRPKLLLLDEPFSSLDARTGKTLCAELKHLQHDLGTTTIVVTHDLVEAEQLADRVAIVQAGLVERVGSYEDVLLCAPAQDDGGYLRLLNILPCSSCRDLGHGLVEADCSGLTILVAHGGKPVRRIVVSAHDVAITMERPRSQANVFAATIVETSEAGGVPIVRVEIGGQLIAAEMPKTSFERRRLKPGASVFVELSLMKVRAGG